jgi:hypothetical protein
MKDTKIVVFKGNLAVLQFGEIPETLRGKGRIHKLSILEISKTLTIENA